jgi:hypothetical protein
MTGLAEPELYTPFRECRVIALPGALGTAGITYDFPGVDYFAIKAVSFTVTTSGGGGARQILVQLRDSTGAAVFVNAAPGTQASGLTVTYSFSSDTPSFGSSALGVMGSSFIEGKIAENMTLSLFAVSAGAADIMFNARVLVEKWPRVHPDYQR